jgi:hypothetical protein
LYVDLPDTGKQARDRQENAEELVICHPLDRTGAFAFRFSPNRRMAYQASMRFITQGAIFVNFVANRW